MERGSKPMAARWTAIAAGMVAGGVALGGCAGPSAPVGAATAAAANPARAGHSGPLACPARDFAGFLRAYASDPATRARFTAPIVKVARVAETEGADVIVIESVPAAEYDGFVLSYRDGKFEFVGEAVGEEAAPDAPGLALIVKPEPDGAYFVTLPDNVEAISYRFQRHEGCWRLTEDPEATP